MTHFNHLIFNHITPDFTEVYTTKKVYQELESSNGNLDMRLRFCLFALLRRLDWNVYI